MALEEARHQKEMAVSEENEKRQQQVSISVAVALALVLVFSILLLKRFQLTKAQKKIIEQKNTHITDSISYAKRIQEAALTSHQYMDKHLKDYFVLYQPKDIVSGDFYWVYQLDNGNTMVAVADCTGHGVPGGFMSMLGVAFLNEIIIENGTTHVDKVLDTMRYQIINALHQDQENVKAMDGLDITLLHFNPKTRMLDFAGAGHKLYITGEVGCKEIRGDFHPVGYYYGKELPYSKKEIALEPDETVYLTSDGFSDQFGGADRKKFGYKAFHELLTSIHKKPMDKQRSTVSQALADWKGDLDQIDDILVMGVRF